MVNLLNSLVLQYQASVQSFCKDHTTLPKSRREQVRTIQNFLVGSDEFTSRVLPAIGSPYFEVL